MSSNPVLVIGDACTDEFIYGQSIRLCPDAPVPVLTPVDTIQVGGMGLNVQANISALGIECDIIHQVNNVIKTRYVDRKTNHTFLRVDNGECTIDRIEKIDVDYINQYAAIVISDYDKGFLLEDDIELICKNHPLVFVDTKKHISEYCATATYIKINENEYDRSKDILQTNNYNNNLVVTLGSNGCRYRDTIFPVDRVEVKDMSGAGDTFMAGLVVKYLRTSDIISSIKYANICATNVVQKRGVAVVDLH